MILVSLKVSSPISKKLDEIASMPEYKVRKQVSIMYVSMYDGGDI